MRLLQNSSIGFDYCRVPRNSGIPHFSGSSDPRRRGLLRLDRELRKGNHDNAVAVAKQLRRQHPYGLCGFGSAKQIPRRLSSLDDTEATGMELAGVKPLVDSMLDSIGRCIDDLQREEILVRTEEDADAEESDEEQMYHPEYNLHMCARHEAGHFLTGYLLGVLPIAYSLPLPGDDDLCKRLRIGGAVKFIGFEFLREVPDGSMLTESIASARRERSHHRTHQRSAKNQPISSKTFNNFSCIVLGGLAAEQLSFGYSEGFHSDIHQLARVIQWLNLSDSAKAHIRWAATNTATILNRHYQTISRLAEAMASGVSIGCCIETIENSISNQEQV